MLFVSFALGLTNSPAVLALREKEREKKKRNVVQTLGLSYRITSRQHILSLSLTSVVSEVKK